MTKHQTANQNRSNAETILKVILKKSTFEYQQKFIFIAMTGKELNYNYRLLRLLFYKDL